MLEKKDVKKMLLSPVGEIRKKNLEKLLREFPGTDKDFADKVQVASRHLSQLKMGTRQMGNTVARRIEKVLEIKSGSMDVDQSEVRLETAEEKAHLVAWRQASELIRILIRVLLDADPNLSRRALNAQQALILEVYENDEHARGYIDSIARVYQAKHKPTLDSPVASEKNESVRDGHTKQPLRKKHTV